MVVIPAYGPPSSWRRKRRAGIHPAPVSIITIRWRKCPPLSTAPLPLLH
jgi:hypothetical protein